MYVVTGVRFEKAWSGNDECFAFLEKIPKDILLNGEGLEKALSKTLPEDYDDKEEYKEIYQEIYDEYIFDLANGSKVSRLCNDLFLQWFFSCDEESAILGVQIFEIEDNGSNTLSEIVNSVKDHEVRIGKKLMNLFNSWGVEDYMIETYLIADW